MAPRSRDASTFTRRHIKARGRIYIEVDVDCVDDGDVVEYLDRGLRTRFVTGRRSGKAPAVRVRLWKHEGGGQRWVAIRNVVRCYRARAALQLELELG